MSLPPGFLDELRARTPLSSVVGRRVTWDARRSNAARGDFWACCPFHQEKSPSFHVDDRKGFYHCFGCHAKGDAIGFLREAEGMSFMEAVAELARLGGLAMPAQDPAAAARAERAKGLADWMEAAVGFYRRQLEGAKARQARAYLARRGLHPATLARFEIGFAPPDRRALTEHLAAAGAPASALAEAGLSVAPEDGGAPYDRFRDRIMFPIRDARGRCVAFGGRALSPDARAKYLNSPETPLFDKSRTLYHHGPAREAAAKSGRLAVVEGYMDAIAVAEAGMAEVVAPLGTAITEHQLAMLWRLADVPVIALDGDAAGLRAALRLVDLALPRLSPGKSLRFATMPGGRDPDELIRAEGLGAFEAALAAAEPLDAVLWRRETEGRSFDTPERRAALDAGLRATLAAIPDADVRAHYRAALADRRAALFRPGDRGGDGGRAPVGGGRGRARPRGDRARAWADGGPSEPTAGTRASRHARDAPPPLTARGREAAILLALANHPALLDRRGEEVAAAAFLNPDLDAVRAAILCAPLSACRTRFAPGATVVVERARETLCSEPGVADTAYLRPGADLATVEAGLIDALGRHAAFCAALTELSEAQRELAAAAGPWIDERIAAAVRLGHADGAGRLPETDSDESGLSQALHDAIDNQIWVRKRRRPPANQ
jgi:DNA primase